ncbi:hypothetical protein [Herbidospora sp. NBRC 101105]|uniref:hypothetical protein n=1 Tax=Herbidospora sp. NBRC 101105 TaxID=3032195 RepID=UPI0024A5D263|nr:hypothetical protein [Herbidospora sp. NBRC 101105]GLX93352.1 hypothetical protein Hesp01_13020 [Herbidospora sp. NBRC 101105]
MNVDEMVARINPARADAPITPGARALLEAVKTLPTPRRRRTRVAVPLAAATAAAVTWAAWPSPAAALDIRRDGDSYVLTVNDLTADPETYGNLLRGVGLDVTLRTVPAAPSLVGTAIPVGGQVGLLTKEGDCALTDCVVALRIKAGQPGEIDIRLGREAAAGERYAMPGQIDAPGEPLHCVDFRRLRFGAVKALLAEKGVTDVTAAGGGAEDDWFVHDGVMWAADTALLLAGPTADVPQDVGPVNTRGLC